MNDFWLTMGVFAFTLLCLALWTVFKEPFRRWYEDDWCRHEWGNWQDNGMYEQSRHCNKCNKRERRHT